MDKYDAAAMAVTNSWVSPPFMEEGYSDLRALIARALRRCATEAYADAAAESEKTRTMALTEKNVMDGMLKDGHSVVRTRAQIRREIAAALRDRAQELLLMEAGRRGQETL